MHTAMDRDAGNSADTELDFQLEVLVDATLVASAFWKNHLWVKTHEAYRPSDSLYERFADRYGVGGIDEVWNSWFEVLTGDEYFVVLTGVDMEHVGDGYGKSPKRT